MELTIQRIPQPVHRPGEPFHQRAAEPAHQGFHPSGPGETSQKGLYQAREDGMDQLRHR
jgi:hypothetical protein